MESSALAPASVLVPLQHVDNVLTVDEVAHCITKHYGISGSSIVFIFVKVIDDFVLLSGILTGHASEFLVD